MIETERLILRQWREGDRAPFLAMCRSPKVMEHLGGLATAEEIDATMFRVRASQAEYGFCFWAIERRADGAFLGFCGIKRADTVGTPVDSDIEIGWRLREDAWGQGYAREAAEATFAWTWANTDAPHVFAKTIPANVRSWRLMERLGMTRRPDLDHGHPAFPSGHPLHAHIVYTLRRPLQPSLDASTAIASLSSAARASIRVEA